MFCKLQVYYVTDNITLCFTVYNTRFFMFLKYSLQILFAGIPFQIISC